MRLICRNKLAVIVAGDDPDLPAWLAQHEGQVFRLKSINGDAHFQALGPEDEARRTPVNITSRAPGPLNLISNFAATPFVLDGLEYASVEGFWQGLKFPEDARRRKVSALAGAKAKDAGADAPKSDTIVYADQTVRVGTWEHWHLMERATVAKFAQNPDAREALLSTGDRPLVHQVRRDSRTIPGVILAEMWMRCRESLRRRG